ncbi:unnamed protein product [Somion occarium]|uniref:Cytochrome P450 n=1 Tax=Somion occarium TaxID=3059160 RepID=A0ABP1CQF7_9APHY
MLELDDDALIERWIERYGNNITFTGLFNSNRLYTVDIRAINHLLMNSTTIYQRSETSRKNVIRLLGPGLLITEGEQHRQQRKIMNPAFGPAQLREFTDIFFDKALQLRNIWNSQVSKNSGSTRIDVLNWMSRMTLDIIGLAGFNYRFDALREDGKPNELNDAYKEIFSADVHPNMFSRLQIMIPILAKVPTAQSRRIAHSQKVARRIGQQLLQEKKKALQAQATAEKRGVKRDDLQGRDLLSLLIKANMATDVPDNQRLSDEDVLAQVPTFLIAGHETTSASVTWCLYALTQAPYVQKKLREELLTVESDTPSMDDLMALPYLDMVVKETLRLHAPISSNMKSAAQDDVIPVNEPYRDKFGNVRTDVRVAKGDVVVVPIIAVNRSKHLWGEDAHEFRPERWENLPEAVTEVPGVFSHLLTFVAGPRACIGYRFSVVEMKAIIFTLVRSFEFGLAVRPEEIVKKRGIVLRPVVISEPENGNQMPLLSCRLELFKD